MKRQHLLPLIVTTLLAALTACNHKDLWMPEPVSYGKLLIRYNWENIDSVNYPEGMRVAFYSMGVDEQDPLLYDIPFSRTGIISLPVGQYQVVTYNYDADGIIFLNSRSYSGLTATTATRGDTAYVTPPNLVGDCLDAFTMRDSLAGTDMQVITFTPDRKVMRCYITIRGLTGISNISKLEATLSGMDISRSMTSKATESGKLIITPTVKNGVVIGDFLTFGGRVSEKNILTLNVTNKGGTKQEQKTDVSDQVDNAIEEGLPEIRIDTETEIVVPKDTTNKGGGAFDVKADEWEDVYQDIEIK